MAEPIVTAAGAIAAKKAIENVVTDLYTAAKESVGFVIKKAQIRHRITRLQAHVHSVRQVKTLWQLDKSVDLLEFYCDSHVLVRTTRRGRSKARSVRRKVAGVASLSPTANVVLEGIAGQGKSILMRYLCSKEITTGERIPLFVELRRIQKGERLLQHIFNSLSILGFTEVDERLFAALAKTGRLLLLLDAFDEIPEDNKATVLNEIEYWASLGTSQIIVSARPDSGIEMSPQFEVVKLDDLRGDEYKVFIRRLTDDSKFADELIERIRKHPGDIQDLLCTPLLVTLLIISYRSFQELPTHLSDFYERIFQDLLQRHDGTKPGFRRKRRCKLSDVQYRQLFDCFSYRSKALQNRPMKYTRVFDVAKESSNRCRLRIDPEEYLKDIIKVTCLLLRDGDECRFIHNSVQEYYAASYVAHRPESVAQSFYEHCLKNRTARMWQQELLFLSEIDKYRYYKHYYLPCQCSILGVPAGEVPGRQPRATICKAQALLGYVLLAFVESEEERSMSIRGIRWGTNLFYRDEILHALFSMDYAPIVKAMESGRLKPSKHELTKTPVPDGDKEKRIWVSVSDMLAARILMRDILSIAQKILSEAYEEALHAKEYIDREDACDLSLPEM